VDRYLIANYGTGQDKEREPWLLPKDAFTTLTNGYTYRGVLQPRKGISELGKLKCMTAVATVNNTGVLPAVALTGLTLPSRGSIRIVDASGAFLVIIGDDNTFEGDFVAASDAIDRVAGTISFTWDGAATDDPTIQYQEECDDPVMGLFNYVANDNSRTSIGMNTDYVSKYRSGTNDYVVLSFSAAAGAAALSGDETDFFSGCMYPDADGNPRLVFVNNVNVPLFYSESVSSSTIFKYNNTTDNPDYQAPAAGIGGEIVSALHIFYFGERLVFIKPQLTTRSYSTGYLYSAINDASGTGDKFNSPGAGLNILPDETPITGATLMGDRLIIFTQRNIWEVTSTQNADLPFRQRRIMDSDFDMTTGAYSVINNLGLVYGFGFWGLFASDGRQSQRFDNKLPFFTRNEVFSDKIPLSNAGSVQEASQLWWTYPSNEVEEAVDFCDRVLTYNFEESSFSQYDLPLTTFGDFRQLDYVPWDDVNENYGPGFEHWAEWDTTDEIWDSWLWDSGSYTSIAGDQLGNVYLLESGTNDWTATITGITAANPAVITVDSVFMFKVGDCLRISDVTGYEVDSESIVNGLTFTVTAVGATTLTINLDGSAASAYTSGGYLSRLYNFKCLTKDLNPYAEQNQRCRLLKLWFYVDANTDNFLLDFYKDDMDQPYRIDVVLDTSDDREQISKKWVPISVGTIGSFHRVGIRQECIQNPGKIHAMMMMTTPSGRLY